MDGGGLHQTMRGGHLNIHADFSTHHVHENWARRVNILLYLNEEWRDEWGGELELWDHDMTACQARVHPGRQPDAGVHHVARQLPRPPRPADLPRRRRPPVDGALLLHRGGRRPSAARRTTRRGPDESAREEGRRSGPTAARSTSTTGSSVGSGVSDEAVQKLLARLDRLRRTLTGARAGGADRLRRAPSPTPRASRRADDERAGCRSRARASAGDASARCTRFSTSHSLTSGARQHAAPARARCAIPRPSRPCGARRRRRSGSARCRGRASVGRGTPAV